MLFTIGLFFVFPLLNLLLPNNVFKKNLIVSYFLLLNFFILLYFSNGYALNLWIVRDHVLIHGFDIGLFFTHNSLLFLSLLSLSFIYNSLDFYSRKWFFSLFYIIVLLILLSNNFIQLISGIVFLDFLYLANFFFSRDDSDTTNRLVFGLNAIADISLFYLIASIYYYSNSVLLSSINIIGNHLIIDIFLLIFLFIKTGVLFKNVIFYNSIEKNWIFFFVNQFILPIFLLFVLHSYLINDLFLQVALYTFVAVIFVVTVVRFLLLKTDLIHILYIFHCFITSFSLLVMLWNVNLAYYTILFLVLIEVTLRVNIMMIIRSLLGYKQFANTHNLYKVLPYNYTYSIFSVIFLIFPIVFLVQIQGVHTYYVLAIFAFVILIYTYFLLNVFHGKNTDNSLNLFQSVKNNNLLLIIFYIVIVGLSFFNLIYFLNKGVHVFTVLIFIFSIVLSLLFFYFLKIPILSFSKHDYALQWKMPFSLHYKVINFIYKHINTTSCIKTGLSVVFWFLLSVGALLFVK